MSEMDAKDWRQEQERLDMVVQKIRARMEELEPEVAGIVDQMTDIRRRFWDEVTVNTSTIEDFKESYFTIRQQGALLSERERSHKQLKLQWKSLQRMLPSPYFGRIDFQEDGLNFTEPVYIGVSSFVDDDNITFFVYDWRTPIASMYYDHSPGVAVYETPGGKITGTMKLKRQYQIRSGELRNVFDTSLTIGDELLQQVLGEGADPQMRSIVATIQKEQNAIIRNDRSRMLIVQGAAGSGKTSAALQRVAYLLYKYREKIQADQIVLFSPNEMFNSYVSTVLPELGEENMQQTTFQDYLNYWLGAAFHLEDLFDQIEYVLTAEEDEGYEARRSGIGYKASEQFLRAIQGYAKWLEREGMLFQAIRFGDKELIAAERMKTEFYSYSPSITLANRVSLLQEWLLRELTVLERKERTEDWVQEELNFLDKEQYAEAYRELNTEKRTSLFDFTEQYAEASEMMNRARSLDEGAHDYADREEELLCRMVVKERFKPIRRSVKKLMFIDMHGLYMQLFGDEDTYRRMTNETDLPACWLEMCAQTKEKLSRSEMFYEDATPYLFLKELVEGVRTNKEVQHVFIDEGQDYSLFQYEFLKKLFPRARMTVLGDFGQAIFTQATNLHESDSPLLKLYGEEETSLTRLVRSYRSTREIVEFTRSLLQGGEEIVPFDRSGGKPVLIQASSAEKRVERLAADLAALQEEGFGSIAVITKTAAESCEAYEALTARGNQNLRLVTKETPIFENGTMVIPAYLAKGVEFDAVLIYDASSQVYRRESERKLFYTACTRAMHRLLLYSAEEWTPYIQEVNPALYEAEHQA